MLSAEPALEGAFAGQQGRLDGAAQTHADISSPPGGMLLSQSQGLRVEGVAVIRRASGTRPIVGRQRIGMIAEALEQLANGAGAEMQLLGDGRSGVAGFCTTQNESTEGHRE